MDERYRWVFPVKDVFGRDCTLGIGIEDGQVIVTAPSWFKIDDPDLAEQVGYRLVTAAYAARSAAPEVGRPGGE